MLNIKNRPITILTTVGILIAMSANVMALPTVMLTNPNGNSPYRATVMTLDGSVSLGKYKVGDSFETFCLEAREYFHPGNTYYVSISKSAVQGGIGPAGDPLNRETAYLYNKFLDGGFVGTVYTGGLLQVAIHCIEGEATSTNPLVLDLLNQANTAVTAVGGEWYGKGTGDIYVLNMWANPDGTGYAQDQLIKITPEPAAILLGGIGVVIVGWLRRRHRI